MRLSRQNRNTTIGPFGRCGIGILPAWQRWRSGAAAALQCTRQLIHIRQDNTAAGTALDNVVSVTRWTRAVLRSAGFLRAMSRMGHSRPNRAVDVMSGLPRVAIVGADVPVRQLRAISESQIGR